MKYVRPYGRSEVKEASERKRALSPNKDFKDKNPEFSQFFNETPEFLIAQYISVIDKIFNKPHEKLKRKEDIDLLNYRGSLDNIVWQKHLQNHPIISNSLKKDKLKVLWESKIGTTQTSTPNEIKGRWHKSFYNTDNKNYETIDQNIEDHLFKKALKIHPKKNSLPYHPKGFISHQASSIEKSVLKEKRNRIFLKNTQRMLLKTTKKSSKRFTIRYLGKLKIKIDFINN